MADRIIKADSGNDVVIQNNGGTRKIEVTNTGDVEVTGDLKATTVKATNLKANDGTASLEVADSTGDIGFSGNTNLKIKLPSAGGIYESDGSTEILTESSGTVTLKNTVIDGTVSMASSGITVRNQEYKEVTAITKAGTGAGGQTTEFSIGTFTYTPKLGTLSGGSKIVFELQLTINTDNASGPDTRTYIFFEISGSGITNFDWNSNQEMNAGNYARSGSGIINPVIWNGKTAFFTTTTNDQISVNVKVKGIATSGNPTFSILSGSSFNHSYAKFMEFK